MGALATGPELVLIAGPTASGKSGLALEMAQRKEGVIVNADSMQIYEGLPILTAQPSPGELALVPHRLYGEVAPDQAWSVAHWLETVRSLTAELHAQGKALILCGGTGLYFKAAEEGISRVPPIELQIRDRWRKLGREQPETLYDELARLDPAGAGGLKPSDTQRLVRALEVIEGTGKPLGHWHGLGKQRLITQEMQVERHLILPERALLHERINQRFDSMIDAGAIEEARAFLARELDPSLPAMKAIGLRELGGYLAGETSLSQACERAKAATRQYAKRQITWFRHQMSEAWVGPEYETPL